MLAAPRQPIRPGRDVGLDCSCVVHFSPLLPFSQTLPKEPLAWVGVKTDHSLEALSHVSITFERSWPY